MDELEERIRARAYQMWENERTNGQAETHWEKARIRVAIEDDRTSLKPVEETKPEEARIMENLGEFRGAMTDQEDERQFPKAVKPAPQTARR